MSTKITPPEKLYRYHSENLRAVDRGLEDVLSSGRAAIARGRDVAAPTYVRLFAFLMGAWSECRLLKLLYEPQAFTTEERTRILQCKALERWQELVDVAFRKHYRIPAAKLQPPALPQTAHARLSFLMQLFDRDLQSIIVLRNKLAHGQWVYPLTDDLDGVAQAQMDALRVENLLSLKQKRSLLDAVCATVHDLAVSKTTFERDSDRHFRLVEQTRINIERKSYEKWVQQLRSNYNDGQTKRRGLVSDAPAEGS
jgi:hypothetical protein